MPGLLDGALAYLYSQGDRAKRHLGGLLSDPVGTAHQVAGQMNDGLLAQNALMRAAFPDERRPFKVGDETALAKLIDNTLAGPMGFAPVGMTALRAMPASQADKMAAVGYEGGWFRGGPQIKDGKMSGPWYTRQQEEAADYARRFGDNAEVREYALPQRNMLDVNMSYSGRLAADLAKVVEDKRLVEQLRQYAPGGKVNGVEIWQGLKNYLGEDGAADALKRLGFGGVRGVNSPDYAKLFPGTVARDAQRAAFDPAKIKGGVDDIYGAATPEMLAAVAAAGGLGLLGLRRSQGDE